jgi:hypothetical protein
MVSNAYSSIILARVKRIAYRILTVTSLLLAISVMVYTLTRNNPRMDFIVFYGSARNLLSGRSPYAFYGQVRLPYWYFPWVSWLFVPLALLPFIFAWPIYLVIGLLLTFTAGIILANYYKGSDGFDKILIFSVILWISWLTYFVGQISFFLFPIVVLFLFLLSKHHPVIAGLLFPLLLIKPHLMIIFIPVVIWVGGKKTFVTAIITTSVLLAFGTLVTPNWITQMLSLLRGGISRTDANANWSFTTLPTFLGFSQNYSGTANLPITIVLITAAALIIFRFRNLQTIPLLSFALAASLFCAPRSYSYDLILLIPAVFWIVGKWSYKAILMWTVVGLVPVVTQFSSESYFLTLLIFGCCIYKAYSLEKKSGKIKGLHKSSVY